MRIVVCVKHVPDIQAERSFGADARVVRGEEDVLNELDENAVEAALVLAEEHGGEVVALTVGPDAAVGAVRKALQLGAGAAVHVSDERIVGADVIGTAAVLAAAIEKIGADEPVDLVITGMASLDGLTSMVPAALAASLGLPALTLAAEVGVAGTTVRVRRDVGEVGEVLEADLPALVSVTDQANEPRYPNFKGIMAAKKKPVEVLTLDDLGLDPGDTGAAGARTRVVGAQVRPPRPQGQVLVDSGDAGLALAAFIAERKFI
jgi:electron transfer flavoprotein beta subunit